MITFSFLFKTYLSDDVQVIEGGHIGVGPCMHRNVISMVPGRQKLFPILENIRADHKMRRSDVIFRQKPDKCIRILQRKLDTVRAQSDARLQAVDHRRKNLRNNHPAHSKYWANFAYICRSTNKLLLHLDPNPSILAPNHGYWSSSVNLESFPQSQRHLERRPKLWVTGLSRGCFRESPLTKLKNGMKWF